MAVIQYESDVSIRGRVLIDGGLPYQFLKADGSLDSNIYALASSIHAPVTLGTANGLSLATQQLSLGLASSSTTGALSGTDWNTFNGKLNTPTGLTTNYLPKWNGSGFGNSSIFDNGGTDISIINGLYSEFSIKGNQSLDNGGGQLNFSNQTKRFATISGETESPNNGLFIVRTLRAGNLIESLRIIGNGNVGIGTPNPTANLTVKGSYSVGSSIPTNWALLSAGRTGVANNNKGLYFDIFNGYAEVSTYDWGLGQAYPMVFQGNGGNSVFGTNVDNGVDKLQVNGSGYFSGDIKLTGNISGNGATILRTIWGGAAGGAILIKTDRLSVDRYIQVGLLDDNGSWGGGMTINNGGSADFTSTISASPATTANQVVVMSQINSKANADGSNVSGTWGINISGNARAINIGTSASISNLNISANDHAVRFDTFGADASNKPISVNNANGVISFLMNHGSQFGKQIAFADNDDLYIRKLTAGTYGNWLSVIHSGNIASQSVNYANSSNSAQISASCTGNAASASSVAWSGVSSKPADWLNSPSLIADHSNANEWKNSGFYENGGGGSNWPTNGIWYNSINVRHSNPTNYHGFQVAMSYYDNNLWYRSYSGHGTFQAWQMAVGSNELTNYVGKTSGNRPGVTRLYRRDSDEPYNLQHNWTGTHWLLRGYYNDDFHAEVKVEYANSAGSAPNANNQNSSYLVTPGDGNGIKFWASDAYKISMGYGSLYQYGPVTDFSIKMQMNAASPDRGFTWGREGITPIAALNATSGNFQTAGNMTASAFFQVSDMRLKLVMPHQHISVENISPITYLWKDPKKRDSPQVGYSAQEVQKVMPYAVSVADDGMLSVNYIQVLVAKVAELEFKLKKHGLE